VVELKPNADGKVTIQVTRTEKMKVGAGGGIGAQVPANVPPGGVAVQEVSVMRRMNVELGDVKDLAITTADGKKLDREETLKKLAADGAVVVVTTDGKPVSPAFLKVFKDDTLVLNSPELTGQQFPASGFINRPGVRPRPLPAVPAPGGVLPANPGGIQIQILPAPVPPPVPPAPEK
jgi:hypothetical protein